MTVKAWARNSKWSKETFLEWFGNQGDICKKYLQTFKENVDDEDSDLSESLEAIANDFTLKKYLKIKSCAHRSEILKVLQNLISGSSSTINRFEFEIENDDFEFSNEFIYYFVCQCLLV